MLSAFLLRGERAEECVRRMAGRSQSWKFMTVGARVYISVVVAIGASVLMLGVINRGHGDVLKFLCYLIVAAVASRLKVNLPGITGTMSVNFLFILLGVLELSFGQT